MALTSMKLTKADQEKPKNDVCSPCGDMSDYPYGLEVRLDKRALKKLGLTDLPDVGTEMTLTAKVTVTMASERDSRGGKDRDLSLQITSMSLDPASAVAAIKKALAS